MRVTWLTLTIVLMPVAAMVGTDIVATCYQTCAESTHSNPEYKACVARAADKADQLLNDSYKELKTRSMPTPRRWAKPRRSTRLSQGRTKAMDRLSQCELHVRGQPRLRRPLDWRYVMSLRSLL